NAVAMWPVRSPSDHGTQARSVQSAQARPRANQGDRPQHRRLRLQRADSDRQEQADRSRPWPLRAAKLNQCAEVPVVWLEHLTETQARAYMLADNKFTDRFSWDDAALGVPLKARA